MFTRVEWNETVSFRQQLQAEAGPIVLVNRITCAPQDLDATLAAWRQDAAFMTSQPGCLSTQLHLGVGGSGILLNYAVWESAAHLRRAATSEQFQALLGNYPDSVVVSPHVFQKLAVPGICGT